MRTFSFQASCARDLVTSVQDPTMSPVSTKEILESINGDNSNDDHSDDTLDFDCDGDQISSLSDENFYQFYATRSGRITKKEIVRSKLEAKQTMKVDEDYEQL